MLTLILVLNIEREERGGNRLLHQGLAQPGAEPRLNYSLGRTQSTQQTEEPSLPQTAHAR